MSASPTGLNGKSRFSGHVWNPCGQSSFTGGFVLYMLIWTAYLREIPYIKTLDMKTAKRYREAHRAELNAKQKEYYQENRERICLWMREHRNRNKVKGIPRTEEAKIKRRNYENNRIKNDPLFRLKRNVGNIIYMALKGDKGGRQWQRLVGYSLEELKAHLEKSFTGGMTWDNYGKWHVDHIQPRSSFQISSVEDEAFKRCWSLDNLQPLWAIDNMRKHAKIL